MVMSYRHVGLGPATGPLVTCLASLGTTCSVLSQAASSLQGPTDPGVLLGSSLNLSVAEVVMCSFPDHRDLTQNPLECPVHSKL